MPKVVTTTKGKMRLKVRHKKSNLLFSPTEVTRAGKRGRKEKLYKKPRKKRKAKKRKTRKK